MGLARSARCATFIVTLVAVAPHALANTPEDLQGVGARTTAMGGAGTAMSGDFTAAYYNPAALTRCTDDHMAVDIRHTLYNLHVRRIGADAPPGGMKPVADQTRITTGFCFHLPYNLAFGMSLGLGLQNLMSLDAAGPNSRPQFVMYGDALQQLSIAIGFAYEPIPQISLGFGGSILVNTDLSFSANAPVATDADMDGFTDPMSVGLHLGVRPTGAPYLGVQVRPIPELTIGATFRGSMYLNLDVPATIHAGALGFDVALPIEVQGQGWYTPAQFAIGVSGEVTRDFTLSADVTYYRWSGLGTSYYPYVAITPQPGYGSGVVGLLGFPRMGESGWRDVWVPRIGGELRLADGRFRVRGGYSFRPSALPNPGTTTMLSNDGISRIPNVATLLDTNTHMISAGVGYYFGDRPDERDVAPATTPEATTPPVAVLPYDNDGFELEEVRGAQTRTNPQTRTPPATTPARTTPPTTATPTRAATAPAATAAAAPVTAAAPADASATEATATDEPDPDLPGITGQIDFMLRATLLQERIDTMKDISYGGTIYDIGVQLTLGWY